MALSAAAAGFVLRARPPAAVFAPAALALLLLARAGVALDVELVLGIFAAFSAAMVVAATSRTAKGSYFAAARLLTLALALVLSYDRTVSVTAVASYADGRLVRFVVEARQDDRLVGSGEITRVVVDAERFLSRL